MEKSKIQKIIQKYFEQECREYIFSLETYHLLVVQAQSLEDEISSLEDKKETIEDILKMNEFLASEKFEKIKKELKEPDMNSLMNAITDFVKDGGKNLTRIQSSIEKTSEKAQEIDSLIISKQRILRSIKENILLIISYVSENDMELVIPKEISEVAYKAFVEYYKYDNHFYKERNIIDISNSELPKDFINAYNAKVQDGYDKREEEIALKWFQDEAEKVEWLR